MLGKKLAEEALTGKRFVRKIFDDGDERLQHDDWKTASEPPLKTEQPWTGTTSFEIRSEFIKTIGNMIQNNFEQDNQDNDNKEEGTFTTSDRYRGDSADEQSRSRGSDESNRYRGETKQVSKVVFHRFTTGSHDNLLELDRCKGLDAHFADFTLNDDEAKIKDIIEDMPANSRLILVIPGVPVKSGTKKDRRRAARAVLAARRAEARGINIFIVIPSHAATLETPEVKQLSSESRWRTVTIDLCELGAKVGDKMIKKQVKVLTNTPLRGLRCQHGDRHHEREDKAAPHPRSSLVKLSTYLATVDLRERASSKHSGDDCRFRGEDANPVLLSSRLRGDESQLPSDSVRYRGDDSQTTAC